MALGEKASHVISFSARLFGALGFVQTKDAGSYEVLDGASFVCGDMSGDMSYRKERDKKIVRTRIARVYDRWIF